jgi:predicted nucleotidyltransferase component of viral defense system
VVPASRNATFEYRFSEDLDYTLLPGSSVNPDTIRQDLADVFKMIYESFGIKVEVSDITITPFPDKEGLFVQIRVPYQGPLLSSGSLPKIKLDLSQEEIMVDSPCFLPLIHHYSDKDKIASPVLCYSLYEIFAEKVRAYVERTRPRDIYDIVHLYNHFLGKRLSKETLLKVLGQKFVHKNLEFPYSLLSISQDNLQEAKADWTSMLGNQIADLQPIAQYLDKVAEIIKWVKN